MVPLSQALVERPCDPPQNSFARVDGVVPELCRQIVAAACLAAWALPGCSEHVLAQEEVIPCALVPRVEVGGVCLCVCVLADRVWVVRAVHVRCRRGREQGLVRRWLACNLMAVWCCVAEELVGGLAQAQQLKPEESPSRSCAARLGWAFIGTGIPLATVLETVRARPTKHVAPRSVAVSGCAPVHRHMPLR